MSYAVSNINSEGYCLHDIVYYTHFRKNCKV